MKEAAGEANMTVITIVLIGVVAAVGLLLVPRLMKTIKAKSCCTNAGGYVSGTYCCIPYDNGTKCSSYPLGGESFSNSPHFSACFAQ